MTAEMIRFAECAKDEVGKIYFDYFDEGIRVIVMRGPASVNCYLGVPKGHPMAGHSYDNVPIECHGGLTFAGDGTGRGKSDWPEGYWYYGYDYAHSGDMSFYDLDRRSDLESKPWTPEEVKGDTWSAMYGLQKLMKLSEAVYIRALSAQPK